MRTVRATASAAFSKAGSSAFVKPSATTTTSARLIGSPAERSVFTSVTPKSLKSFSARAFASATWFFFATRRVVRCFSIRWRASSRVTSFPSTLTRSRVRASSSATVTYSEPFQ